MRSCGLALAMACVAGCEGRATTAGGTLVLNEFMAWNTTSLMDDAGAYSDWIELHNTSDEPTSLGGVFLSDDAAVPDRAPLSDALQIEPGGFLVLFADASLDPTDTHLPFAIEKDGEALVLSVEQDGEMVTVDEVTFGVQAQDASYARTKDGAGSWEPAAEPTPGESNE